VNIGQIDAGRGELVGGAHPKKINQKNTLGRSITTSRWSQLVDQGTQKGSHWTD